MHGTSYTLLSFYNYAQLREPARVQAELLTYCTVNGLRGKIYVAAEGVNGNINAAPEKAEAFKQFLHGFHELAGTVFKTDTTATLVYPKMFVRLKRELVHLGRADVRLEHGGKRLSPAALLQLYASGKEFVIIDTRNGYESVIGHFKNALTPAMENFREWPDVVEGLKPFKDKTVVTYCTGGIRCEKASAYMVEQGFTDVYQLDGGILTFIQQYPDTVWQGGMFVFDERRVVEPNTLPELRHTAECIHCGTPTSYHINCHNLACDKIIVCCHTCKVTHNYCCSEACKAAPNKRTHYTG